MFLKFAVIVLLYFTSVSFSAPVVPDENDETQLLDYFQSRGAEEFEFKYELSDGQMREEKIKYDDMDNGIAVKGSYKIELDNGEMQTIYYISDTKGHRISINVPFTDDGSAKPPPTRKPQDHTESKKKLADKLKSTVEEQKSFEDNRIDDNARKARLQTYQKAETVKENKVESVKEKTKSQEISNPEKIVTEKPTTTEATTTVTEKASTTKAKTRVTEKATTIEAKTKNPVTEKATTVETKSEKVAIEKTTTAKAEIEKEEKIDDAIKTEDSANKPEEQVEDDEITEKPESIENKH